MAARLRPAAHIADFVAPASSAAVAPRGGRLQAGSTRSPMNAARVTAARALPPAKTPAGRKAVPVMEKTAPVKRSTPRPLPSKMQPSLLETVAARTTKAVPGKPAKVRPVAPAPSVQNTASRKATPKTPTRTRAKVAAQSTLFDVPVAGVPAAAKPVVRASGSAKKAAVKPTPASSVSTQSTGGKTTHAKVVQLKTTTAPVASRKKPITAKTITAKTITAKPITAKTVAKPASAQTEKATSKSSPAKPAKTKTIAVRKKGRGMKAAGSVSAVPIAADPSLKRVRSRPNLSEQYAGNTVHKERAGSESAASKRARRDAAARERLKQLMNPDDELIRRLAQAGAISPLLIDGEEEPAPRRKKNTGATRRPRKWDLHCGKCGAKSTLQTPAGLCFKCGTIVVRFD